MNKEMGEACVLMGEMGGDTVRVRTRTGRLLRVSMGASPQRRATVFDRAFADAGGVERGATAGIMSGRLFARRHHVPASMARGA